MTEFSQTVEVEVGTSSGISPDATVIWMHGLGADGHDFEPIVSALDLPPRLAVRFVFPHAPVRPVTINNGMSMRAWYDIFSLGGGREDEAGLRATQQHIDSLIVRERARGIAADRIVLAGFSQGGAVALMTALRFPERLAGVMALSTYLPLAEKLAAERQLMNADLPVFMAHGREDEVISIDRATSSRDALMALGYPVEWVSYAMGHAVCPQEVADIGAWLGRVLS
ncbi:MAG: alpha/beta hydrolase-fold protein [Rugosibacter sp.]|nr:alpha/beta hydrolase-fold protein [Rugosibacter sp.]